MWMECASDGGNDKEVGQEMRTKEEAGRVLAQGGCGVLQATLLLWSHGVRPLREAERDRARLESKIESQRREIASQREEIGKLRATAQKKTAGSDTLSALVGAHVEQELKALDAECALEAPSFDMAQVEDRLRKGVLRGACAGWERWFREHPMVVPRGSRCPHCDTGTLKLRGRDRRKRVTTTLGTLTLWRNRYECDAAECRRGTHPLDLKLDLQRDGLSPGMRDTVCSLGVHLSFEATSERIGQLLGVWLSGRNLQNVVRREGEAVERDRRSREPEPPARIPEVAHAAMDGTAAPMKPSQVAGRKGRGEDGKARSREVKLVSFHQAELLSDGHFRMLERRQCGAIESAFAPDTARDASPFAQRVQWSGRRSGFDQAPVQVMVGDGAPWIWNLTRELYPRAHQILDLYHVREHLREVAKARWGTDRKRREQRRAWVRSRLRRLRTGHLARTLAELDALAHLKAAHDCARYFRNNRSRMDYQRYEREGWCCSSAVIESACKHLVADRIKGSGRHWNVEGVNAIVALRCAYANEDFDSFAARRHQENAELLQRIAENRHDPPNLKLAA